jgi:hypothetical protein
MFCSNCGQEVTGNFCSNCGAPREIQNEKNSSVDTSENLVNINGTYVDLQRIVETYGKDKIRAIKYLRDITNGLSLNRAKNIIDDAYEKYSPPKPEKKGFWESVKDQARQQEEDRKALKEHIMQMDKEGVAYCPKCYSTSLSAHKKGFGIGKAVVGASLTGGIGLVAGNIGAKKVRVTCLKCGHQFWAGKK